MSPRRDYTLYDSTVPRVGLRVFGSVVLIGWLALGLTPSFFSAALFPLAPLVSVSALGMLFACLWFLPISHRRADWVWAIAIFSPILVLLLVGILHILAAG